MDARLVRGPNQCLRASFPTPQHSTNAGRATSPPCRHAIAALFQPVRNHIQTAIDRRFYRRKYDATRTLTAFGSTLRDEVNFAELKNQVVAVVEETMRPAHISMWLRPPRQPGDRETASEACMP